MRPLARDLLLAADRGALPELDRLRRHALDRELGASRGSRIWGAIAAGWVLIAVLSAFTPGKGPADPGSAELARAVRLLGQEAAALSRLPSEPFDGLRIPWM